MAKQVDSTNLVGLLQDVFTKIKSAFWAKGDTSQLSIDNTPTSGSNNLVKSGGVYTELAKKYEKPSGGIPASDIASGVIPSVPVTDVTVGGTSVLNSGTAVIPAIPTVPTISSDIPADKTSTTKTASPKGVYDEVHPAVASSQPQGGFLPNVLYNLGELTGSVTFALATPADNTIVNHYYWTFETGTTAPTITWPSGVSWVGGSAPTINADKHYEISVLNGIGTSMEV